MNIKKIKRNFEKILREEMDRREYLIDGEIIFETQKDLENSVSIYFDYYRVGEPHKQSFIQSVDYFGTDEYIKKRLLYEVKKDIENIYWSRRKYEYSK